MTTTFEVYGGLEQRHLPYFGVKGKYIDSDSTNNVQHDRKYSLLGHTNELDNFNQPHYELHHECRVNDNVKINCILYIINGKESYD